MTKTMPLKWHGGKSYLADRIIQLMPPHVHYVEPYFGGGAVLFRKPCEGVSEVVNDINYELTNFWSVLRSESLFSRFFRDVEAMPFSQVEFGKNGVKLAPHGQDVLAAEKFFVRYRQSRQGLGKDFATLSRNRTRRGMNEQVSSWLTAIDSLPEAHERLKRVVILNDDALKVIKQQDGPNTLYYLDPPYLHETRHGNGANGDYEHEMTEEQHKDLLDVLSGIQGKFILSGYPSMLYDQTAIKEGWHLVDIEIDNKASGKKQKEKKCECLWMNFEPEATP